MSSTSKFRSTPTYSFKGRNKSITSSNESGMFPSPNHYNPEKKSLKKSPQVGFPKAKRMEWSEIKSKQLLPGPGSHQPVSFITAGPKKTINRKRFRETINSNPSPGQYNNSSMILKKSSPSFSMQKKTASSRDLTMKQNTGKPSPGQYEQPIIKFHSTIVSIGKSKRPQNLSPVKTPGPGSYNSEEGFKGSILSESKCKIGKQLRTIDFSLGQRSPGPGNYQTKSNFQENKNKQRGFSCRMKTALKNHLESIPGPGQYETPIQNRYNSTSSIKVPHSARPSFTDQSAKLYKHNPGPGAHELEPLNKVKFRSMSVHKFSKSKVLYELNPHKSVEHLSPMTYTINDSFNKHQSPSFSISKHSQKGLFTSKTDKKPGPGSYEPKQILVKESEFTHKMQKSERPNMVKHLMKNPGPGQYTFETNERLGRKFKFPKKVRQNYHEQKIRKQSSAINHSYQSRQQFPNPPKYMGVTSKIKFNEERINKYMSKN